MEKATTKAREFAFYSTKNGAMVRVHSSQARDYAKYLEAQPWVEAYEPMKALELERVPHVSPMGIRKLYFQTMWCSDFYIRRTDGGIVVRELSSAAALEKLAEVEKLELSRRYWAALDITDWKGVLTS